MNTPAALPPDYHSHTVLCKHAVGKPIEYARVAVERGLTEMACTEHCPAPEPFDPAHRMDLDEFGLYRDWIREAQDVDGLRILFGVEADYYEGCEEFLAAWLPGQALDYVLGSVHYLGYRRDEHHALTGIWDGDDIEASWTEYFRRIGLMADTGLYDVASHLDLPKKFGARPSPGVIERLVKPALDRIARAGMGIEINTSGFIHEAAEQYPSLDILKWAHERNIPISFGSDAHKPERMGADFARAVQIATTAGYTERARYRQRQRAMVPLIAAPD